MHIRLHTCRVSFHLLHITFHEYENKLIHKIGGYNNFLLNFCPPEQSLK